MQMLNQCPLTSMSREIAPSVQQILRFLSKLLDSTLEALWICRLEFSLHLERAPISFLLLDFQVFQHRHLSLE